MRFGGKVYQAVAIKINSTIRETSIIKKELALHYLGSIACAANIIRLAKTVLIVFQKHWNPKSLT